MQNIPKELHLYWDGSPMSHLQALTTISFHDLNPTWKINVYTPKQVYNGRANYIPPYSGEDFFYLVKDAKYVDILEIDLNDYNISSDLHNILRSDIFRYHILYKVGGVWSDFDVLWLKPMEHFNNIEYYGDTAIKDVNTVVSFIWGKHGGHSIGVLIHCKEDPYMLHMKALCEKVQPPYTHEIFGSGLINKAYPTLESFKVFNNVIGTKFETYYPYNIHPPKPTIQTLYKGNDLKPLEDNNVMCLHWYNGHVLSKRYVNNGGYRTKCSMTTLLTHKGYI